MTSIPPSGSKPSLGLRPVTVEHHRDALGIGVAAPRLSWTTETTVPGWVQQAYEIEITGRRGIASTGRVTSDEQVLVAWPGAPLRSRERVAVRARVWGAEGGPSPWSPPVDVEAGLLDPDLWTARMISPALPPTGSDGEPAALLRSEFDAPEDIVGARLRTTAHGVMTVQLNGSAVGEDVLHPGWTTYHHRLRYRSYDVGALLRPGRNAIGVHLADGWFRGYLGFAGRRDVYGDTTAALVQLELEHSDGRITVIGTDGSWRSALGPVSRADLYMGESYDARRELPGWAEPHFDDSGWAGTTVVDLDTATLVAPDGPAVRRTGMLPVVETLLTPTGRTIVDFGQNLVGRLRVRIPAGTGTITFRHAEVLEDGELGVRPLRAARATDEVTLAGEAFTWEPDFTFHGFRYAEVTGWPGELDPDAITAIVIHTDMRRLGTFETSDALVNRLHENIVWSMRGNFLDVPTDCPQRDERLGWTGDLQVFAPAASFLYDTAGMLTGWLADLAADQNADGTVPIYVPWALVDPSLPPLGAEAGWGDAATIVPWTLFERHGDAGILRRQWTSMTAWVDAFEERAGTAIDFASGGFSFGDWLDSAAPDDQPWAARLPWQAVATAYLAHSAAIVRDSARILGDSEAAERYHLLFDRAAQRYRTEFVTATGRAAFASQTAYALGLRFWLLLPEQRSHAGELLAARVAEDGFRIGSGFLGTPHVADALADTGHGPTAWKLLLQTECPSWLYAVSMGATTVWERWNSMLPDGSINPGDMTSFNHYAFGAVADFLHRRVGGLAPAAPGYRRLRVAPLPDAALEWARTAHETPYGRASVSWTLADCDFAMTVEVPPSTHAEIELPDGSPTVIVGAGTHHFSCVLRAEPSAEAAPLVTG